MNIDPETGKNYGLPPTAEDVRNFAAELDDRDGATQAELDTLRLVADRLEQLERDLADSLDSRLGSKGNAAMKTHAIVVLSDGETWATLDGCSIVVVDDAQFRDLCEDRINAEDLVAVSEISLIDHTPKKASPERIITGDCDPTTGTEYGTLS